MRAETFPASATATAAAPRAATVRPAFLRGRVQAWLREPLLHFGVIGVLLFAIWPLIADRVAPPPNIITISNGQVQRAVEIFSKTHARPPGADELAGLIEQEVQTEVFFREGMALGLDRNDEIIRRRVSQKLKFMIQDVADQTAPTDAELQSYLDAHRDQFGAEPQIAFSQIYINPDRHGNHLEADVASLRARLNRADGRLDYGVDSDVLPVPNDFEATRLRGITSMFGEDFATALASQPPGTWAGPIRSGYGLHLVLVRQRIEGAAPRLQDVRGAVLREWQAARRAQANQDAYRQARAKYAIRVEPPGARP